ALPRPEAPVHRRADGLVPAAHGPAPADRRHPRLAAEPRKAAAGLPLQPALPALRRPRRRAVHPPDDGAAAPAGGRPRALRRLPPRRGAAVSTATLEVQGLTKEFGRRPPLRAVDDVSFTLSPGKVTALVG